MIEEVGKEVPFELWFGGKRMEGFDGRNRPVSILEGMVENSFKRNGKGNDSEASYRLI